jgi:hypothetical protein
LFEEWINVEQLMAHVFRHRCFLQYKQSYDVFPGRVLSFFKMKLWSGLGLLFVVVLILWGPLVLSVLAQVYIAPTANSVKSAAVDVSMNILHGSRSSSVQYPLFTIKAREILPRACDSLPLNPLVTSACNQNFIVKSQIRVQSVEFNGYSDTIWTATPEIRDFISKELKEPDVKVNFRFCCSRAF